MKKNEPTATEESFPGTDVWVSTGQRDYDGRTIFIHRRTGRRAIIGDDDRMQQALPDYPWYEKYLYESKE